ncbi:beta/alpha barrel domain-containing protein [Aquicella lusitana]|uniref:4-hydroxy 2-oxovalerate aldolase n=1 Tax=Aquicella lusitana TaxID=254246 RepID=A0A370G1G7_9COXI|nr:4-hydroxy-2-oxovalerate aldolase [Aquicella lusitana]RDI37582.1 4-hydroxy 2-oxovalerate aldolase [Aquicella lusitana]VVC73907.1 4-hydroxy-2-oxovalerate aldolase [Aquicella lusitana]
MRKHHEAIGDEIDSGIAMKNNIKLLDVTLRDGGYKTNFHFSSGVVRDILTLLDQSGVRYIEVGYRNGPLKPIANMGQTATCDRNYLEYCKKWIQHAKLTVILHPKNIQRHDLEEMQDCGVNAVRICFPAKQPTLGFQTIEMASQYNFEVFANITRVSHFNREQIRTWVTDLAKTGVKAIYLADSNGSLTPDDVDHLYSYLQEKCHVPFGFHAHDNLFLAQANAVAAIKNGVQFIDASLFGFGKGSGNLRTEGIVSFLHAGGNRQYDFSRLMEAANYVKQNLHDTQNDFSTKDIILGIFDLSQDDAANLGSFVDTSDYYSRASQYLRSAKSVCGA